MTSKTKQLIVLLIANLATVSATDIYLPSLPQLTIFFNASENLVQLTLPMYLLGSLFAAPLLGTLSDHFERKSVLLIGMLIFILGSTLCMYSVNLPMLIVSRFVQGMGAIVTPVVGWALLQDLYPSDKSAKVVAWMGSIISIGPLVAPALGGVIDTHLGWQATFLFSLILGLISFMSLVITSFESKSSRHQNVISIVSTLSTYLTILKHKRFLSYNALFAILICGEWGYFTIAPFYFESVLKLSSYVCGLFISSIASAYIIGSLISPTLINKTSLDQVLSMGAWSSVLGAMVLLIVYLIAPMQPILISIGVAFYFIGIAFIWGPATSRALQQFNHTRGAASAVRSIILVFAASIGGFIGSFLDDMSLLPLALFLSTTSTIVLFISYWLRYK